MEPPFALAPEVFSGVEEAMPGLHADPWLFPPNYAFDAPFLAAQDGPGVPAPLGGPALPPPAAVPDLAVQQAAFEYQFTHVSPDSDKELFRILLNPFRNPSDTRANQVTIMLGRFARTALEKSVSSLTPFFDGNAPRMLEAKQILVCQVQERVLNIADDFVMCLEAFNASYKEARVDRQRWITDCLVQLIQAAVEAAPEQDRQRLRDTIGQRIECDDADLLYVHVDVRSWSRILDLWGFDTTILNPDLLANRIDIQILGGGLHGNSLYDALMHVAQLVDELRQAEHWGSDKILEVFNNRESVPGYKMRFRLMACAMRKAPRTLVRDVLYEIDSNEVDAGERFTDDECELVRELLKELKEDVRCCPNTFYKMKSDWLVGTTRWGTGVAEKKELSPEQICDHIEGDYNYDELLKIVVNKYKQQDRKFEIARMLARDSSHGARVAETNRNDKQLSYLVELYAALAPMEDEFGPIDQETLVLPCKYEDVLFIDDSDEGRGSSLDRLRRETLQAGGPMCMGISWFWRCFDPKLDFWPRAQFLALAYNDTFAIVDFNSLEGMNDEAVQEDAKGVVRDILSASHILKVTYHMDDRSMLALQRALFTARKLAELEERRPDIPICPVLPMSMMVAYYRRTNARRVAKWTAAVWDFMALEVCTSEALSNFDRRPLRASQFHYALTVAWCPLVLLRAFLSWGADAEHLKNTAWYMMLRLGCAGQSEKWDEILRHILFCGDDGSAADFVPFGEMEKGRNPNPWFDADWLDQNGPRPDTTVDVWNKLVNEPKTRDLFVHELREAVWDAVEGFTDKEAARAVFDKMYQTFDEYWAVNRADARVSAAAGGAGTRADDTAEFGVASSSASQMPEPPAALVAQGPSPAMAA